MSRANFGPISKVTRHPFDETIPEVRRVEDTRNRSIIAAVAIYNERPFRQARTENTRQFPRGSTGRLVTSESNVAEGSLAKRKKKRRNTAHLPNSTRINARITKRSLICRLRVTTPDWQRVDVKRPRFPRERELSFHTRERSNFEVVGARRQRRSETSRRIQKAPGSTTLGTGIHSPAGYISVRLLWMSLTLFTNGSRDPNYLGER